MDPQAEVRARLRQRELAGGRGERRPVPRGQIKSEKNDEAAKQFEEERKAWREKNAAKLASQGASSLNNGGAEEEQQMAKGRELQQSNRDSLARSLLMAKQAGDVGQETLMKLTSQREQMKKMDDDLDKTNESLNRSERVIRGMKSTWGGIKNLFTSPSEHRSERLDNNIKIKNVGNEDEFSNDSGKKSKKKKGEEEDEVDPHHVPLSERDLSNENEQTRAALQEFQEGFKQEDEQLEELGDILSQLKGQAKDMNVELKQQEVLVDHLGNQVDKTHTRIKKADTNVKQIS